MPSFLKPPVFPDEALTEQASQVHIIEWTVALGVMFFAALQLVLGVGELVRSVLLLVTIGLTALVILGVNRAGRPRFAAAIMIVGLWGILTGLAWTGGGLKFNAAWGFFIVVFMTGQFFGNRAAMASVVGCGLTLLVIVEAAPTGGLPVGTGIYAPFNRWLVNLLFLSITCGLQYLAARFARQSLQRARHALTERTRAEAALLASEERFRAVFEQMAIGMTLRDLTGRPLLANAALQQLLGYSAADLADISLLELAHPSDVALDAALYLELVAGRREAYQVDQRYRGHSGAEVWARVTASLVRGPGGAPQFTVTTVEDISQRQRANLALRRYAARMEVLHDIDRGILTARLSADTARAVVSQIRTLIDCDVASVSVFGRPNPEEGINYSASATTGATDTVGGGRFFLSGPWGRQVQASLREGHVIAFDDVLTLADTDDNLEQMRALGLRSWVHLPLRAAGQLIGALNLARVQPGPFGLDDRDIAREVADQLAIAIHQGRLLEETTEALQREQRLNAVARAISGTLDWQTVVRDIMRLATEVVGATGSLVGLLMAEDEVMFFPSFFSETPDAVPPEQLVHQTLRRGQGLIWQLIDSRAPMRLDDYGAQPGALPYLQQLGAHALLAVPLIVGDRVLGGLGVYSREPQRVFTERDQNLIESIGRQAGLAIQNSRLFEAERAARLNADVLVEAAQLIASSLSLPEVLQQILAQVKLVPAVTGAIFTETADGVEVIALLGYEGREAPVIQALQRQAARTPLQQRVRAGQQPLLVADVTTEAQWVPIPEFEHIRSFLAVPLIGREGSLGVLSVDSDRPGTFTPQHVETVRALAAQAAIAIENARLFGATRRQLSELTVLHAGAVAAMEAVTEDGLIERATQIIGDNLYSSFCGVALVDPNQRMIRPHPSYLGLGPDVPVEADLGEGIVGIVALTGQPMRIGDVRQDPRFLASMPGILSELCVPLKAGQSVIGAFNVESDRLDAFSAADERLLVTYAGLLAAAIVRLRTEQRLEQRVAARTRELSAVYDVSAIASRQFDLPAMVAQALARVLEAVESDRGAVFLLAGPGAPAADEAADAPPALGLTVQHGLTPDFMAQLEQPAPAGLIRQVLRQGEPIMWPGPFLGDRAAVGLPMKVSGVALGVLTAFRAADQPFNVEEVALLASTADALSVSVENVQLRQQAEQSAVAFERERLARDLHDSVTQALYSLTLFAEAGHRLVHTPGSADTLDHYLVRLGETSRQALKDLRLMIHNLRPSEFAPEDLVGALNQRLEAVERRSGVAASLSVEGTPALSPAAADGLYWIAQEALNNSLKHSGAAVVRIRLYNTNSHTILEITDDGRGFAILGTTGQGGMGLRNMQTRAQQLAGSLTIDSAEGQGTTVVVTVPRGEA